MIDVRFWKDEKKKKPFDILLNGFSLIRQNCSREILNKNNLETVGTIQFGLLKDSEFVFHTSEKEVVYGTMNREHTAFRVISNEKNNYDVMAGEISIEKKELNLKVEIIKNEEKILSYASYRQQVYLSLLKDAQVFLKYMQIGEDVEVHVKKEWEMMQSLKVEDHKLYENSSDFGCRVYTSDENWIAQGNLQDKIARQYYEFLQDQLQQYDCSYGNIIKYLIEVSEISSNPIQLDTVFGKQFQKSVTK